MIDEPQQNYDYNNMMHHLAHHNVVAETKNNDHCKKNS